MFYRPGIEPHGLPHNPFKAIVSPRPIGWISTVDKEGRPNLAPYSFFNAFADAPPVVAYGTTGEKIGIPGKKDTLTNIRDTEEFVVNIVGADMTDAMNVSSQHFETGVDEFERAGLIKAASETVTPPRIDGAPASLECTLFKIIELPGENNTMVLGVVTGIHYNDAYVRDGIFDATLYRPMARMGYRDYARVDEVIQLRRPDD